MNFIKQIKIEHVGYDPGRVHANIHCQKYNHVLGTGKGNSIVINDPFNTFHTYKLDWNSQRMIFYVDDKQYFVSLNLKFFYSKIFCLECLRGKSQSLFEK
jgi:hypothetical protein